MAVALLSASCATPHLSRLEAVLAANQSATDALEQWCASRGFADPARVIADTVAGASTEPADARMLLGADAASALGFRHVRLSCGGRALSEAYNWYVPGRLTPAMNETLERTRTPFGKVAAPLGFRRERLASRHGAALGCPVGTVLSQRALLRLPDGQPLALLVECYSKANLRG